MIEYSRDHDLWRMTMSLLITAMFLIQGMVVTILGSQGAIPESEVVTLAHTFIAAALLPSYFFAFEVLAFYGDVIEYAGFERFARPITTLSLVFFSASILYQIIFDWAAAARFGVLIVSVMTFCGLASEYNSEIIAQFQRIRGETA